MCLWRLYCVACEVWPVNWGCRVERARKKKPFVPQGKEAFRTKVPQGIAADKGTRSKRELLLSVGQTMDLIPARENSVQLCEMLLAFFFLKLHAGHLD